MPDHINIANPDRGESHWRHRMDVSKLEAELAVTRLERDHYRDNLEAIHTRIGRGDEAWLTIDGEKVIVRAVEPPVDEQQHEPQR